MTTARRAGRRVGWLAAVLAAPAAAQSVRPPGVPMATGPENTLGTQSDAEIWLQLRHAAPGLTQAERPEDAILINPQGWWWSELRTPDGGLIVPAALWILGGVLLLLVLVALLRGRQRIQGGRSGRRIRRHRLSQIVAHWSVAVVFLILAITGLAILLGRPLLIPLIGRAANSVIATASLQMHNLFGPIFGLFLVVLFVLFVRHNLPARVDVIWLLKGGGFFGHVPAGRYNAGEKLWFWTLTLAGVVLVASGVVLLFPDDLGPQLAARLFGLTDQRMATTLAQLAHVSAAILVIAFSLGHIYLGTWGTEGTLESMIDGCVDENWARTHHDLWLEETGGKGEGGAPCP